ncbi:MAG TPA: hypothetical protein VGD07_17150 [Methylomirabilota bacterium]
MAKKHPGDPVTCWLCDRTIGPDEPSNSLLGMGIFIVHVPCYERELHGRPPATRGKPARRARRGRAG